MMVFEFYLISVILIIQQLRLTNMSKLQQILLGVAIVCDSILNSYQNPLTNGSVP